MLYLCFGFRKWSIAGLFYASIAFVGSYPWFERVGTHAQLADAVSRGDVHKAKQERWKHSNADLIEVLGVVLQAVGQHASKAFLSDVVSAVNKQRIRAGFPATNL